MFKKTIKKAKTKSVGIVTKARRYMIISSVVLNVMAAGGVIGAPYLTDTGLAHAANLPGAGLKLRQVAYLSQSIPSSQLHEMPTQVADAGPLPDQAKKPARKPKAP